MQHERRDEPIGLGVLMMEQRMAKEPYMRHLVRKHANLSWTACYEKSEAPFPTPTPTPGANYQCLKLLYGHDSFPFILSQDVLMKSEASLSPQAPSYQCLELLYGHDSFRFVL